MPRLIGYAWKNELLVCFRSQNGNLGEASFASGAGGDLPSPQAWKLTALNAVANAPLAGFADITAYAWPAGNSKQVAYTTQPDHHIHEIHFIQGGSWHHDDLTQLTGAPPCDSGILSGFPWNAHGTKQVAYLTKSGHIHELYTRPGGPWHHADLTQLAGAPLASPYGPISGYAWEREGTKQLVFKDTNGHIHELYVAVGGSWKHADLTQLTGSPAASGRFLAGFAWEEANTKQVIYVTGDGHIHELYVGAGQTWRHADLTTLTGAPAGIPSGESFAAFSWPKGAIAGTNGFQHGMKVVDFVGSGGHVHEIYVGVGSSWIHHDLTQRAGGEAADIPEPDVSGLFAGYTWAPEWVGPGVKGASKQVAFTSSDGHIHQLVQFPLDAGGAWDGALYSALPGLTH